ncbi:uncharacterized protein FIBRA_04114 [Fibroporia radiculosa]|uniref:Carboxypeptidase n=1 Tax=Fibroporia radiculosa TaxID=599839 RepID=J4G6V1_9APHY|nr:uncharacterized protein FIBRA_04114 [Fibroporia radiculosa]CCM02038.1 predicted protein [Fibroporia radiculosa]
MLSAFLLTVATFAVAAANAAQTRLSPPPYLNGLSVNGSVFEPYNTSSFVPLEDLSLLSITDFTTLRHPVFPQHSVRVKKSNFCDGSVAAYTGYIDVQARHLFFYFFESRHDPDTDDVLFWTNGGPGCSSSSGVFMELGPCKLNSPTNLTYNPYSWNERANVFFIDQPVGVGFSYAEYGETVTTTPEAAKDVAAFVAIFFEHFSKFKGRGFHMAGESYGGRYIPVFASAVYDQNTKLIEAGMTPINLTSIMIGNGLTNWATMIPSYYEIQCSNPLAAPVQDISTCVRMKQALGRCEDMLKTSCLDKFESIDCNGALLFCLAELDAPYYARNYNPYYLGRQCDGGVDDTMCYPITKDISAYLSRTDIRTLLGVDPSVPQTWVGCKKEIFDAFLAKQDELFQTQLYIAALLERGVRALIYVGANDYVCNWCAVTFDFMCPFCEWTGQDKFAAQPLIDWYVDGEIAGATRSSGNFTFASIYGAGHLAPYDKPKASMEMINRWMANQEL